MKSRTITKDSEAKIADRLTVLLGLAGLLKDGAFGAVTERQGQALQEMLQTSEELRGLLLPLFTNPESTPLGRNP